MKRILASGVVLLAKAVSRLWSFYVSDDFSPGPAALPSTVADLAADPEAPYWARHCGWVPGTGHCRNRACSTACLFRAQREAEAVGVRRARRRRRPAQALPTEGFGASRVSGYRHRARLR